MAATEQILIRLKPVLAAKVRRQARREATSMNAWLTAVIEREFQAEKPNA